MSRVGNDFKTDTEKAVFSTQYMVLVYIAGMTSVGVYKCQ